MTPQEYALKMLHILKSVWLPARGWIYTIEKGYADAYLIQTLSEVIQRAARVTTDEQLKNTFKKSLHILDSLKEHERTSLEEDQKYLESLDGLLDELEDY